MNNVLLTVGAACVVLAIVGTGGKVLGVELPVIQKQRGWRLGALAVVGCVFLAGGYLTRDQTGGLARDQTRGRFSVRVAGGDGLPAGCGDYVHESRGEDQRAGICHE